MRDFRQLDVWWKAHQVTLDIYEATRTFPKKELYGLTSQMRRSAISVPSNIAEGCGRGSDGDFGRFLDISMGSANELEYQVLLARDLSYFCSEKYESLTEDIQRVKRMSTGLIKSLKR